MYLLDTNVLVRFAHRSDPRHGLVRQAVRRLAAQSAPLCFAPQSSVETWNVCTRPVARNGLGLATEDARRLLRLYERVFTLLPDDPAVHPAWKSLVERFVVSGVQVHDARLVAFLQVYQIPRIVTFNTVDFLRYAPSGIVAMDPAAV